MCFCCKLIQRCNTKYLNFVCVLNWLQNQEICKPCPLNIHRILLNIVLWFVTRTFRACGARQFFWFPLLFPFCGAALLQMIWGQGVMNQGGTSRPDQICGRAGDQEDVSTNLKSYDFLKVCHFFPCFSSTSNFQFCSTS